MNPQHRPYLKPLIPLALTLGLAGLTLPGCGPQDETAQARPPHETQIEGAAQHQHPTYVCPMHPQVVSAQTGRCPICGMDLVLRNREAVEPMGSDNDAAVSVRVPSAVVNQLGVRTATVRRGTLARQVEGFGSFLGIASRGFRPANRASDPNLGDPGAAPSMLVAQVFERDAPRVHLGQTARVRFPYLGAKAWTGTVSTVETQVNPNTRTLQFRVSVDLEGASVPGGITALVTLEVDPVTDVLLVPREAVILTGKGAHVILAKGEGRFQPREVEAEDLGGDEMVIRSGLQEGDQVVVSAQFLLDSEASLRAGLSRLAGGQPEVTAISEETAR